MAIGQRWRRAAIRTRPWRPISGLIPSLATGSLTYGHRCQRRRTQRRHARRRRAVPEQQRPLGNTEAVSSIYITRNSYTSTGWAVLRANFRFPGETPHIPASSADSEMRMRCWSAPTMRCPRCLARLRWTPISESRATARRSTPSRVGPRVCSTATTTRGAKKLIGRGRRGTRVQGAIVPRGRTNSSSVWFDEDGTAIVCVLLEDGSTQFLSFAPDGKMTRCASPHRRGFSIAIPGRASCCMPTRTTTKATASTVAGANGHAGVCVRQETFRQTVQEIESGAVNADGAIFLFFRCDGNAMMVAKMGHAFFLFRDGDEVPVELPVNLYTLIGGARSWTAARAGRRQRGQHRRVLGRRLEVDARHRRKALRNHHVVRRLARVDLQHAQSTQRRHLLHQRPGHRPHRRGRRPAVARAVSPCASTATDGERSGANRSQQRRRNPLPIQHQRRGQSHLLYQNGRRRSCWSCRRP